VPSPDLHEKISFQRRLDSTCSGLLSLSLFLSSGYPHRRRQQLWHGWQNGSGLRVKKYLHPLRPRRNSRPSRSSRSLGRLIPQLCSCKHGSLSDRGNNVNIHTLSSYAPILGSLVCACQVTIGRTSRLGVFRLWHDNASGFATNREDAPPIHHDSKSFTPFVKHRVLGPESLFDRFSQLVRHQLLVPGVAGGPACHTIQQNTATNRSPLKLASDLYIAPYRS